MPIALPQTARARVTRSLELAGELAAHIRASPRHSLAVYALVVAAVGGWMCFKRVSQGALIGDEGFFAVTTERMLRTGDYVVPYADWSTRPHLNATPLYNWLSCLTAGLIGEGELRYRFWAAVFGVGCGLATFALGAVLFGPEVGLLAGLFVVTDPTFLFCYGARRGTMNSGVTFFVTLAAVFYVCAWQRGWPARGWWALVGAAVGAAVLTKPPIIGTFFFVALVGHHILARTGVPLRDRWKGPVIAALAAAAVALPWYVAVYLKLGPQAVDHLILFNSVKRATVAGAYSKNAPVREWWYYATVFWDASAAARIAVPALLWAVVAAVVLRRGSWGLLAMTGGGFVAALSVSVEKHPWYLIPAFPFTAVAVAALLLGGVTDGSAWRASSRWYRCAAVAGLLAAVLIARFDFLEAKHAVRYANPAYAPYVVHKAAAQDLAADRVRLVMYQYPGIGDRRIRYDLGLTPAERIYPALMPHAIWIDNPGKLERVLAEGKPTVVFIPSKTPAAEIPPPGLSAKPDGILTTAGCEGDYVFLTFHGGEAAFGLDQSLFKPPYPIRPFVPGNSP